MINFNYKGVIAATCIGLLCILMVVMALSAGCITAAKEIAKDAMATPTPTPSPEPTPTPTPTPTPRQTPAALPTLEVKPVNPFLHGERSENQWFKWQRTDVSGTKDMYVGIVAYRHKWLDKYTWWNGAIGNYQIEYPMDGQRFFVVWVHQEMMGETPTFDPRMWGMDAENFRLQYKNQLIETDKNYLPVNRILELDEQFDYYHIGTAPPFGYRVFYTGNNPETAGMVAEQIGWLRMGKGNSIDGFMIFQVPKEAFSEDMKLLGSFSTFGSAYWTFEDV